jgi:hypothetical protein
MINCELTFPGYHISSCSRSLIACTAKTTGVLCWGPVTAYTVPALTSIATASAAKTAPTNLTNSAWPHNFAFQLPYS